MSIPRKGPGHECVLCGAVSRLPRGYMLTLTCGSPCTSGPRHLRLRVCQKCYEARVEEFEFEGRYCEEICYIPRDGDKILKGIISGLNCITEVKEISTVFIPGGTK